MTWKLAYPLTLVLLTASPPSTLAAQSTDEFATSREVAVWGANAALGGLSAAIAAVIRRDPLGPAVLRGASGGTLVYAGKRIAVQEIFGMGLLGRQVSSVGGSIVGNAVAGRSSFDEIALAIGPVRFYSGREVQGTDWAVDVPAVAFTILGMSLGGKMDVPQSLSSGAVVLKDYGDNSLPGNIWYSPGRDPDRNAYVLAHEQVHILQYDQSFLSWGAPIEDWTATRFPRLEGPLKYMEFNIPVLVTAALLGFFVWTEHDQQLWEPEAMYLGRTR